MRTTVAIDEHLLAAAKRVAREREQTLGQFIEGALQRELAEREAETEVEVPVFRDGNGPSPGLDLRSNRALLEALDDTASLHTAR